MQLSNVCLVHQSRQVDAGKNSGWRELTSWITAQLISHERA